MKCFVKLENMKEIVNLVMFFTHSNIHIFCFIVTSNNLRVYWVLHDSFCSVYWWWCTKINIVTCIASSSNR